MGPRALLAAVCLLGGALCSAQGQTRLEWKLKEGDRFFVEVVNTLKGTTKLDAQEYKAEMEITAVESYKVLKSDATGVVLEKTILARKFKSSSSEMEKQAELVARKLQGDVLTISFDAAMQKVTRIDGMRDYMKRLLGDESADPGQHEETIKDEQQNIFAGFLPDKPLQPGQHWRSTTTHASYEPTANYTADGDYTYKGREVVAGKPVDRIDVVWTVNFMPPKLKGPELKEELNAEAPKASYFFDSAAGRLVKSDRSFHVKGKITMTSQGKQRTYELDHDQSWRIRLTDENPLSK